MTHHESGIVHAKPQYVLIDADGKKVHRGELSATPAQIKTISTPQGRVFTSANYQNLDGDWVYWEAH